ncbi:MAG: hypothetical protein II404_05535 [Prevotella sp.]|nr:hypothetical protein [Prevotella sp.]
MEVTEKKLERWKEAIPRMNEEDLEFILDFPECFEPQILKLVKSRMKAMSQPKDDKKKEYLEPTMESLVCETLDEMGCYYEFDDDDDIFLEYQDEGFFIMLDENDKLFIQIYKDNWITVSVSEYDEVSKLYQAINSANYNGHIAVTYTMSEDKREIRVHFNATILFAPFIPDLKGYLDMMLGKFFIVRILIEEKMKELFEKDYAYAKLN